MSNKQKKLLRRIIAAAALLLALGLGKGLLPFEEPVRTAVLFVLYLIPYYIVGHDILAKAWRGIRNGRVLDECFLMAIATVGAFAIALLEQSGEFAEAVAEYVFRNQMELWGEQAEREMSESLDLFNTEKGAASSLLSLLPKCFTTADLISLRSRKGQSVSTSSIYTLLSRWKSTGRIEKTSDGRYLRLR